MLSDLRESGSIEQDSDVVILLHREDAYERESPRAGEADFIVAKHRNGPTTTVTVAFQGHYSRFRRYGPHLRARPCREPFQSRSCGPRLTYGPGDQKVESMPWPVRASKASRLQPPHPAMAVRDRA